VVGALPGQLAERRAEVVAVVVAAVLEALGARVTPVLTQTTLLIIAKQFLLVVHTQ
jgi:hypothetical protein